MSADGRPGPSRVDVGRDLLSFAGGWYLIIYQAQFAPVFNLAVFVGGMVIAGVPGAVQAWNARPGGPGITGSSASASPPGP